MPILIRFTFMIVLAASQGGCAVMAVGSAALGTASLGVKAVTTVGGLAVDGASAAARAGANAVGSDTGQKTEE